MGKAHLGWIDVAKGLAILAVVLGHTYAFGNPVHAFVYSFHIPLFFVVAGYTFRVKPLRDVLRTSATRLLLPYAALCAMLGIHALAVHSMGADGIPRFLGGVLFASGGGDLPWGVPAMGLGWFLVALFVARVLYTLAAGFLDGRGVHPVVQLVVFAAVAWVAHVGAAHVVLPCALWQGVIAVFFMHVGRCLGMYDLVERPRVWLAVACLAVWAAGLAFGVFFSLGNLFFVRSFAAGAAMAVAGTWCILQVSRLVDAHVAPLRRFLSWAGVNSLLIMCLHQVEGLCVDWMGVSFPVLGAASPAFVGVLHVLFALAVAWLALLCLGKRGAR